MSATKNFEPLVLLNGGRVIVGKDTYKVCYDNIDEVLGQHRTIEAHLKSHGKYQFMWVNAKSHIIYAGLLWTRETVDVEYVNTKAPAGTSTTFAPPGTLTPFTRNTSKVAAPNAPVAPSAPVAPVAPSAPVAPVAPSAPVAAPTAPVAPVTTSSAPVAAPTTPVKPIDTTPVAAPTTPVKPIDTTPVAPVTTPSAPSAPTVPAPVTASLTTPVKPIDTTPVVSAASVVPVTSDTSSIGPTKLDFDPFGGFSSDVLSATATDAAFKSELVSINPALELSPDDYVKFHGMDHYEVGADGTWTFRNQDMSKLLVTDMSDTPLTLFVDINCDSHLITSGLCDVVLVGNVRMTNGVAEAQLMSCLIKHGSNDWSVSACRIQ
jgi:hypothetical protein